MACAINFPVIGNSKCNTCLNVSSTSLPNNLPPPSPSYSLPFSSAAAKSAFIPSTLSLRTIQPMNSLHLRKRLGSISHCIVVMASSDKPRPLRIMIAGAPASGKGTQCELIVSKYSLVHISAGDLLREEIASGSENGKRAKEYMDKGLLVPNEIVVLMVKDRLSKPDSQEKGWLLDGYPRSLSQATALKESGFHPDLFILLDVPEELLVERVVGRRLDPVMGKIYHLKYSPPENEEIAARLTQRFDDTEEKVKLRLQTHNQNVEAVVSMYEDIMVQVDGSAPKNDVFAQIDKALAKLAGQEASSGNVSA